MKKGFIISVLIVCIGFLYLPSIAGLTYQHEYKDQSLSYEFGEYADEMLLYAPKEYGEKRESPTPFSHTVHGNFDCGKCHHDEQGKPWDGTYEIIGCMSTGCHDMAVAEEPQDRRDIRYFYKTYHDMCMSGCHRELGRAGEETGPTACPDCHTR